MTDWSDEKKSIGAIFVVFATVCYLVPEVVVETMLIAGAWTAIYLAIGGPHGDQR